MNKILKINFHVLIILTFSFVCFHFLWLNPYSMKWDLAEQYLPWRYFIGKSIQNHEIPFWNSFQLGGYPFYADPQSGFWYYPTSIIGYLFGYSMKVIELEILAFIITAGLGYYYLLKKLNVSALSSCIFSISYLASGFIVGNAQHITWIAAAAWLPWLFYHYICIRKDIVNINFLWFLIITYLFISSSYPAFAIITAYIFAIDQFFLLLKTKQIKKFIIDRSLFIICLIIILSPIIYSLYVSRSYFSRGDGIVLEKALQHPFTWQSLLSLLTPFASFKNPELFKTDISMSNAYIGILPIITIICGFFNVIKRNLNWLLLSFLFLLIGFGAQTPFRELLYNYIPGFNLFRFPALFRLFFIISILIYSAKQFDQINFYTKKNIILIFTCMLIFTSFILININSFHFFKINSLQILATDIVNSNFIQHIVFQISIHVVILLIILFLLIRNISVKYLLIVCCIDLFLSVRLNAMSTIVLETKTKDVDALIVNAPKKFITPNLSALKNNIDQNVHYRWPLNWNMNCYFGQIAIDGYNPFVLKTFNDLSDSKIKDSVWNSSWYYFQSHTPEHIQVLSFSPNNILFEIETQKQTIFAIAQNPYKGWKVFVNGIENKIEIKNYAHQSVKLKPGKYIVEWRFEDYTLKTIYIMHILLFSSLLIFVAIKNISNLHYKH